MKKILFLFLLYSCASALREEGQIVDAPKEMMTQKIEELADVKSLETVAKPVTAAKTTKVTAAAAKDKNATVVTPPKTQKDFVTKWPFGEGEQTTFIVRYGPIEGGKATIEVAPIKKLNGEVVLHYIARAQSHKVFELFYRVDDLVQSWVRLSDHLTLRHEILQNESGQWGRRVVVYDQNKKEKHFYSSTTRPKKPTRIVDEHYPLHHFPQDILSAYFFSRFIKDPKKINFPVHDRARHWNNEYVFEGKENIKTKIGDFMCNRYKVYPRVQGDLEPRGDAYVWITDDERKIMTKFKVKIRIGSITGDLVEYKAGKPWNLPLPHFVTPLNLDPKLLVENK